MPVRFTRGRPTFDGSRPPAPVPTSTAPSTSEPGSALPLALGPRGGLLEPVGLVGGDERLLALVERRLLGLQRLELVALGLGLDRLLALRGGLLGGLLAAFLGRGGAPLAWPPRSSAACSFFARSRSAACARPAARPAPGARGPLRYLGWTCAASRALAPTSDRASATRRSLGALALDVEPAACRRARSRRRPAASWRPRRGGCTNRPMSALLAARALRRAPRPGGPRARAPRRPAAPPPGRRRRGSRRRARRPPAARARSPPARSRRRASAAASASAAARSRSASPRAPRRRARSRAPRVACSFRARSSASSASRSAWRASAASRSASSGLCGLLLDAGPHGPDPRCRSGIRRSPWSCRPGGPARPPAVRSGVSLTFRSWFGDTDGPTRPAQR